MKAGLAAIAFCLLTGGDAMAASRFSASVEHLELDQQEAWPKSNWCDKLGGWQTAWRVTARYWRKTIFDGVVCSSYTDVTALILTDAVERRYLLIFNDSSHGTDDDHRYIAVFQLDGKFRSAKFLRQIELSRPTGLGSDTWYEYRILRPDSGGLRFVMKRHARGGNFEWPPFLPRRKTVDINVSR